MSSTVTDYQVRQFKQAESKRHSHEMKKVRTENERDFRTEIKNSTNTLSRMKNDYETQISNMKNDLEQKLSSIRKRHAYSVRAEDARLAQEITDLKKSHKDQKSEIKVNQSNELDDIITSHKNTLKRSEEKFRKEQSKFEPVDA
jgi:hypothetical protein